MVHDSLPRVTRSGLSPAVTKWFDLIEGTHKTGVLEAFTKGALVTDGGQTYRERTAIQGWLTGRRIHHHPPGCQQSSPTRTALLVVQGSVV